MSESTNIESKIWVLVDSRIGNANQAIDLAEKLQVSFNIKHIEYNHFAKLPSSLLSLFPIHIKKAILSKLKNEGLPEVIISSGRRTAPLALYLKKISKGKTKIIQIMRPNLNPKDFELIILPQHDSFNYTLSNIIRIIGALTNAKEKAEEMQEKFEINYPNAKKFIAVLVGGSSKNYTLTLENAKLLANIILAIEENHALPLFISFSRRTPNNVKEYFKKNFSSSTIYDPVQDLANPYPAMIQKAQYVICTGDSISMCSEVANIGKPIYIFSPSDFKLRKHHFFIQQLVDLGIAKRLDLNTRFLEEYKYKPFVEIDKVVSIIKEKIPYL